MGRAPRPIPKGLGRKLYLIRRLRRMTLKQMAERVGPPNLRLYPGHISEFERGVREPPLIIVLRYARLAQVPMEVLVDEELSLPDSYRDISYVDLEDL